MVDFLAPFTGSAYVDAANNQRNYLTGQQGLGLGAIQSAQAGGLADLAAGRSNALAAIGGGALAARNDITRAVPQALASLYSGRNLGTQALTGAVDPAIAALQGGVGNATDAYRTLLQNTGASSPATAQALADSLGLNGPEGTARAQAQFTGGPGFQFGLNTGLDALTRGAAAGGGAAGGNILRESQRFGQDYGTQKWQEYVQNLQNALTEQGQVGTAAASGKANAALTGGTGAANIYTGTGGKLADLLSQTGANAANIYTGQGTSLANISQQGGLAQGGVYSDTAAREAALQQAGAGQTLDLLKAISTPYASTYNTEALARTQGPLNLFNLVGGVAKFGAGGGFNPSSYSQVYGS